MNFASIYLCRISVTSFSLHLSAFLSIPLLCRWVGRSRPCRWTRTERSSGLNTVKYNKPTWRQWVTLRSRTERGCHWLSKTWAAVRFTPKPSSITRMEGMRTLSPGPHDCLQWPDKRWIYNHIFVTNFVHFCMHQVCCGVWRWRVYHLYCNGFEEQELRLSAGVCLGAWLIWVSMTFEIDEVIPCSIPSESWYFTDALPFL